VRYYSAWEEDDRMLIQNEYCENGSLAAEMLQYQEAGRAYTEAELCTILKHVVSRLRRACPASPRCACSWFGCHSGAQAKGIQCLHHAGLVHLDIKPGNILIKQAVDSDLSISVCCLAAPLRYAWKEGVREVACARVSG
jgi:wee1-like protein kinase